MQVPIGMKFGMSIWGGSLMITTRLNFEFLYFSLSIYLFSMCINTGIKRTAGPIEINFGMSTSGVYGMVIA